MTKVSGESSWNTMFDEHLPTFERLRAEVDHTLRAVLADVRIHDIRVRVKKKSSFLEKIDRKNYHNPFGQMTDIVGARVVCLFVDDIDKVESAISREFDIMEKEDKTDETKPEIFGYQSVHYLCAIKDRYQGLRYEGLHGLTFEVQVRTILQDAWAVVEHTLGYKNKLSLPPDLRRDFSALAGLLHVADKTFQQINYRSHALLVEAEEDVRELLLQTSSGQVTAEADIKIDRNTLKAFLSEQFPDREDEKMRWYSALAEEIISVGVTGISQLKKVVEETLDDALEEERDDPPLDFDTMNETRYNRVGMARQIMGIAFPGFKVTRELEE
ncbi:GTP pyrophosphokinase family protein [Nocardia sp. NPDC051750]|uniref:GTP pyrophosphokinase family protein n=1 Tax=Nocardia sp. NPDC051750 TaxID=3364325 RepID=UPI0037AF4E88